MVDWLTLVIVGAVLLVIGFIVTRLVTERIISVFGQALEIIGLILVVVGVVLLVVGII
jgi:hypothetical protein